MGCSLIAQGVGYVQMPNQSLAAWGLAAITFAAGAFLLAGLMTPFVAVFVAAGGIGIALSWIPLPGQALFDSYLAIINLIVLIDSNSSSRPRCLFTRCADVRPARDHDTFEFCVANIEGKARAAGESM